MPVIVDDFFVLLTYAFFTWGLFATIGVLAFALLIYATPAKTIIGAKIGHKILLNTYRRDGVAQIKTGKYIFEHIRTKDGYYLLLPNQTGNNKGMLQATCYEETGTPIHPLQAAAAGLFIKQGFPDWGVAALFNIFVKNPSAFTDYIVNGEVLEVLKNDDEDVKVFDGIKDFDVVPRGTFKEIVEHSRNVLGVTTNLDLLKYLQRVRKALPEITKPKDKLKYPVYWSLADGLGSNVIGTAVSYADMAQFQIYHNDPSMVKNTIEAESMRLAKKYFKDTTKQLMTYAIVFAIIVGVVVLGYVIITGQTPQLPNIG